MPLQFTNKIEAVQFGDLVAMPRITSERLMRISKIKFDTKQNFDEALDTLAECFDEHSQEVRKYMNGMFLTDLSKLQAYLVGGEEAVNAYNNLLKSGVSEVLGAKDE